MYKDGTEGLKDPGRRGRRREEESLTKCTSFEILLDGFLFRMTLYSIRIKFNLHVGIVDFVPACSDANETESTT